ncbi:MAG: orotidine-5'-phosphate decarboxylase [Acidobacteriota bacterium]
MNEEHDPLQRVAVALDTREREEFSRWCRIFGPRVGVLKVGLEAFVRWGPPAVAEARRSAKRVFLDLKLHDIPNTVAGAVAAARELGVDYLTVHASGGPEMLRAAGDQAGGLQILAVTLLTHLDEAALARLDLQGSGAARVASWADLARDAGCAGIVCSPLETAELRAAYPPPFLLVTPGIRIQQELGDDQRRTASPAEALAAGADLLVIGRPLTRAADPGVALDRLARALGEKAPDAAR